MQLITYEAEGRAGTQPRLESERGACSLTLLTTSSLTLGPTNWRIVAPLILAMNLYMMQQKPIPCNFFGVLKNNAEDPSLPSDPVSLLLPDWEYQGDCGENCPIQCIVCLEKVTANTISPKWCFWRQSILHTSRSEEDDYKMNYHIQTSETRSKQIN